MSKRILGLYLTVDIFSVAYFSSFLCLGNTYQTDSSNDKQVLHYFKLLTGKIGVNVFWIKTNSN